MAFTSPGVRGEAPPLTHFLLSPIMDKRSGCHPCVRCPAVKQDLTLLTVGCGSPHTQASLLFPTLYSPYATTHVAGDVFPT
jgi:hypothetical protein